MTSIPWLAALCLSFGWAVACAGEVYGQPDAPLAAVVLGVEVHTADPDEMQYAILQKLTDHYAAEHAIAVTPEEIGAYLAHMKRDVETDRRADEARRDVLIGELSATDLPQAERKRLSAELDALNQLLADDGTAPPEGAAAAEEDQAAREQIAAAFIRQWKINRALYEQYGGRIIFQQGGPEPLDAYHRFLKEREGQGAFEILNKEFEPRFWRYYVTDSIHSFYPAGSTEEARAFQTPWWLSD